MEDRAGVLFSWLVLWFAFNPFSQSVSLAGVFRSLTSKVMLDNLEIMSPACVNVFYLLFLLFGSPFS